MALRLSQPGSEAALSLGAKLLSVRGAQLLGTLEVQRRILLYLLSDGSRVFVFSYPLGSAQTSHLTDVTDALQASTSDVEASCPGRVCDVSSRCAFYYFSEKVDQVHAGIISSCC